MTRLPVACLASSLISAVALAGCASTTGSATPPPTAAASTIVAEAAALLPDDIVEAGSLVVGTSPGLEPFSYRASDGQITGAEIDLVRELATRLGLDVQLVEADVDGVLAGVESETYDIGVAGIFNTPGRRMSVDFVDYLRGGTRWAVAAGADVDPSNACGLRAAAIEGSVQADVDIPGRSRACVESGDPPVGLVVVPSSAEGVDRVLRGEADAFVADAPVVAHLVGMSKGRLVPAGAAYDPATYAIAVTRAAPDLREALEVALQAAIEDGTYARIIGKWGIQEGSISLR